MLARRDERERGPGGSAAQDGVLGSQPRDEVRDGIQVQDAWTSPETLATPGSLEPLRHSTGSDPRSGPPGVCAEPGAGSAELAAGEGGGSVRTHGVLATVRLRAARGSL